MQFVSRKKNKIAGHLLLRKSVKFAKTIFYFLREDELSSCKIVATEKPVNMGDGEGMQLHWNRKVHRHTETTFVYLLIK